jgi:hypothetical protein
MMQLFKRIISFQALNYTRLFVYFPILKQCLKITRQQRLKKV